jgi:hypothetical protein
VIPEIDIWRAADLMLKRYGEKAFEESSTRADELAADVDHDDLPPGPVHRSEPTRNGRTTPSRRSS